MKLTLGTRYFMAPEMVRNPGHIEHDLKVDTWAVGVLTFFILTAGQYPFPGTNKEQLDSAILNDEPAFDVLRERGVSESSIAFIQRCLVKDPAERASASELVNDPWVTDVRQFATQNTMLSTVMHISEHT